MTDRTHGTIVIGTLLLLVEIVSCCVPPMRTTVVCELAWNWALAWKFMLIWSCPWPPAMRQVH
jgi:hypothetical protein